MIAKTSILAYENKKPKIKTDQDKILAALSTNVSMTYNEIAHYIGWYNPNKVSRRMPELKRLGKVKMTEVRKCKVAKSECMAYVKIIKKE